MAIPFEQGLAAMADAADRLTRYAFIFRYPGTRLEPTRVEFDRALADAESLYALVLRVLPSSVHP